MGQRIHCGAAWIGKTDGSSSEGMEISKKDGNGRIDLINWLYKAKTPIVVCLVNNYDTRVFAFFISIYGKIFIIA